MPRDGRHVWQPSNAPRKSQNQYGTSIFVKKDAVPPIPKALGNQPTRRFAGSVVWGKLPLVPRKSDNVVDDPAGKPGVVNEILKDDESWETEAAHQKNTAQEGKDTEKDITSTMAGLTVQPSAKTGSTVPEWRRNNEKPFFLKSLFSQSGSLFPRGENQNDRPFRCKKSVMSCTYQQTPDQPRMVEARPDDYRPFFKHEFVLGTILRGIIHEQDIMGTPDPAMSQAPTQCTHANKLDGPPVAPPNAANRHVVHGEWGPIYSENRFLIVVHNRPGDHYYAVPVYSHKGSGLAKKRFKNEYVSVADGRYPGHVQQQSEHRPITAELKSGVDELLPMSAAYASYAVPRKYGLPVAYQGKLDKESTRRLVGMYHEWTNLNNCDEL